MRASESRVLWRIVDANINRALEGARAVEELVRFDWDDRTLTSRLRRIRHGVASTVRRWPGSLTARLKARDITHDVGRRATPHRSPNRRTLLWENLQRVKEALRVLEECARAMHPRSARAFQQLRFEVYASEQAIARRMETLRHSRRRRAPGARHRGRGARRH